MGRRTQTTYKAQFPGKSAQHDKAPGSGYRVNVAVVQLIQLRLDVLWEPSRADPHAEWWGGAGGEMPPATRFETKLLHLSGTD